MTKKKKLISIIIPVYYNELNLPDTVKELLSLAHKRRDLNFEFIFVDDGSKDKSLQILRIFKQRYTGIVRVVKLTRNFGSMAAIQAGFSVCKGDYAGFIAADLQDPPELFLEMLEKLRGQTKVCFAVRKDRHDPWLQKAFATLFYFLLRKFAFKDYPDGGFDFLLVKKEVVKYINKIDEKNVNIMNLIYWMGFPYETIPYVRRARTKGKSRWTFSKRFKLLIDSFVGYSYFPIRLMSLLGIFFAIGSFLYLLVILISWWYGKIPVRGWATMMVVFTMVSGIQMFMIGMLGEYLWRTLDESRKRPNYVIDEIE